MNPVEQLVDYSRQEQMDQDLNNTITENEHMVIGCGGVGWWMAVMLTMMGAKRLVLIDGDRLEATNLNRLPVPLRMHDQLKVRALKAQLRMLRPGIKIMCIPQHLTADTVAPTLEYIRHRDCLVWDCTDDARIQIVIYQYMDRINKSSFYRKAGYDRWLIGSYQNLNVWLPDDYHPGYTTTHANALTSAMSAVISIMAMGLNQRDDVTIDVRKLILQGGNHDSIIS